MHIKKNPFYTLLKFVVLTFIFCFWSCQLNWARAEILIKIGVNPTIIKHFKEWTKEVNVYKIDDFSGHSTFRAVPELILMHQAFEKGGLKNYKIQLIEMPNYARALAQANYYSKKKEIYLPGESIWESQIDEKLFYATDPIVRSKQFEQGIFTLPENEEVLKIKTKDELIQFPATTQKTWSLDVAIHKELGTKRLEYTSQIKSMYLMLKKNRVKWLFWTFPQGDPLKGHIMHGVKVVPVPNIKIGMPESRSWLLPKSAPHTREIFEALQRGIRQLRRDGKIERAFYESGFLNENTKSWKVINN